MQALLLCQPLLGFHPLCFVSGHSAMASELNTSVDVYHFKQKGRSSGFNSGHIIA